MVALDSERAEGANGAIAKACLLLLLLAWQATSNEQRAFEFSLEPSLLNIIVVQLQWWATICRLLCWVRRVGVGETNCRSDGR